MHAWAVPVRVIEPMATRACMQSQVTQVAPPRAILHGFSFTDHAHPCNGIRDVEANTDGIKPAEATSMY